MFEIFIYFCNYTYLKKLKIQALIRTLHIYVYNILWIHFFQNEEWEWTKTDIKNIDIKNIFYHII